MTKIVFVGGDILAEDFSYARALVELAVTRPEAAALLPDLPPEGILKRLQDSALVTPTNEQSILAERQARIDELQEQLESRRP